MNEKTLTFEVKGVEYEMELDEASSKAISRLMEIIE